MERINFKPVETGNNQLYLPAHVADAEHAEYMAPHEHKPENQELKAQHEVFGTDGHGSIRNELQGAASSAEVAENEAKRSSDEQQKAAELKAERARRRKEAQEKLYSQMLDPENILDLKARFDTQASRSKDERTFSIDRRHDKDGSVAQFDKKHNDSLKTQLIEDYTQTGVKQGKRRVRKDVVNKVSEMMDMSYEELEAMVVKSSNTENESSPQEQEKPSNSEESPSNRQERTPKETYEKVLDEYMQEFMTVAEYRKLNELNEDEEAMQSNRAARIMSLNVALNSFDGLSETDKEHQLNLMAEFLKETDPGLKEAEKTPEPIEVEDDEKPEPIIIDDLPPIVQATPDGPVDTQINTTEKKERKNRSLKQRVAIYLGVFATAFGVGAALGASDIGRDSDKTEVSTDIDESDDHETPSGSGVDFGAVIDEIEEELNDETVDDSTEPSTDTQTEEEADDSIDTDAESTPTTEEERINQVIEDARASSMLSQFAGLDADAIQTTGDVWPWVNFESAGADAANINNLIQQNLDAYNQAYNRNFVYAQDGMFWEGNSVINPAELAEFNSFTSKLVEEANN